MIKRRGCCFVAPITIASPVRLGNIRDMPTIEILGVTTDGRWELGIGDPTPIGWVTVFAYFAAAVLCIFQSGRCRLEEKMGHGVGPGERYSWMVLAVVLSLLGMNKQLDLQTAITQFGRDLAVDQGWYGQRRVAQRWFRGLCDLTRVCAGRQPISSPGTTVVSIGKRTDPHEPLRPVAKRWIRHCATFQILLWPIEKLPVGFERAYPCRPGRDRETCDS